MNRYVSLTTPLPARSNVHARDGIVIEGESIAELLSTLSLGAIEALDSGNDGVIRGLKLRVSSEKSEEVIVQEFWQDCSYIWIDGNRQPNALLDLTCFDPCSEERFRVGVFVEGKNIHISRGPVISVRVIHHDMNESYGWDRAMLPAIEQENVDLSTEEDSVSEEP